MKEEIFSSAFPCIEHHFRSSYAPTWRSWIRDRYRYRGTVTIITTISHIEKMSFHLFSIAIANPIAICTCYELVFWVSGNMMHIVWRWLDKLPLF